jgi:hypothetical protein
VTAATKTPAAERFESWKGAIARLHEDLTGLEQVQECFGHLFERLHGQHASFSRGLFGMVRIQRTAIGVRRLFNKGSPNYPNVAIQRLLKDISSAPDALLRLGAAQEVRAWAGVSVADERAVREQIGRDLDAMALRIAPVAAYANTIAHLQHVADDGSDELRMRVQTLRTALAHGREHIDCYSRLLTGSKPCDLNKDRFILGFEEEIDRLLSHRRGAE